MLTDEASISIGAQVFKANCAACHGASGEGNAIGPNLTDNYWIHGGSPDSVYLTIHNGVPSKGMQAWKDLLTKLQLQQVYSFSLKIKGTNVSGGKAPQGKEGKF
ncbi:MAG TPA: hypothetical protein DCR43_07610 [Bacteroidales bacterium]|nr:hypothetical protein [Bacteroidales bacterium]